MKIITWPPPLFQPIFSRFFSFPEDYGRTVRLNDPKLGIQADITNIKVEFKDAVDPLIRLDMTVVFNNIRSS